MFSVEVFIENLCCDMNFPEKIKRELFIQMKKQINEFLKNRVQKILKTYEKILPSNNIVEDISFDLEKEIIDDESSTQKKGINDKKRMNLSKLIIVF